MKIEYIATDDNQTDNQSIDWYEVGYRDVYGFVTESHSGHFVYLVDADGVPDTDGNHLLVLRAIENARRPAA